MKIGTAEFDTRHKTYVMGILNVTPDSFSDGGKYQSVDRALQHAQEMIRDGAAILDVGGESTRPGYEQIPEEEELERVIPVIEALKREFEVPVSLDTYKSRVARAGLAAGADLLNDIWGLKYDADMANVIAESGKPCCLMHNRAKAEYRNFLPDVLVDLSRTLQIAKEAGITDDRILLDPGIGFGKTHRQNLYLTGHLEKLHALGYPLLLGTSRKSMIGKTLNLPVTERVEGTLVTTVLAVLNRCAFVRVHDVRENVRAVKMAEAILNASV